MKELIIIGKGYGWENAPHGLEAWGVTQVLLKRPVDAVIDMNVYDDLRWGLVEKIENEMVIDRCKEQSIPYIGLDSYPIEMVREEFQTDFFTNTVDYAIALAIIKGYESLHLHGVNMTSNSEYGYQKPGVSFWCGVMVGRGGKVTVHGPSDVLRTEDGLIYGYGSKQGDVNHAEV